MLMLTAINRLQVCLERGCTIKYQDEAWWLFERNGEGYISGKSLYNLIENIGKEAI